jgi:hypothetical protein
VPILQNLRVRCDRCGFTWKYSLGSSIEVANGNTITFAPGSIQDTCSNCGAQGINVKAPTATATTKEIRGLFAVLQTVSASTEDFEHLAEIAYAAKQSRAEVAELAEQIKTSIPSLQAVGNWMQSKEGQSAAQWITVLLTVLMLIISLATPSPTTIPASRIIVQCPSDKEQEIEVQEIRYLLEQIAREIRSDLKTPKSAESKGITPEGKRASDP